MNRSSLTRVTVGIAAAALVVPGGAAHAAPSTERRAAIAASWQVDQLEKNRIPSSYPGYTDWGLTIDTALALAAQGGHKKRLNRVSQAIENNYYAEYATYDGDVSANAMAKTLTAAVVLRENPRDFGDRNVRRMVLRLVAGADAGNERGRVRDSSHAEGTDYSNTFGQALAVIGLARSGKAPQSTVSYLLRQQCREGYFRLYPTAGQTCNQADGEPDVDATALAVQALFAARKDGKDVPRRALRRAVRWLVSVQRDNGGFPGGTGTESVNSNSTGLAAQALAAAGRKAALNRAAGYVGRMQITKKRAGDGPARSEIGAIAYDAKARRTAVRDGITDTTVDQFRRATAQGIFAFTRSNLVSLKRP